MKTEPALSSFEDWTLRIRQGRGRRILLLLHGWTGHEDSMSIFIKNFPTDRWIISPRAPFPAHPRGYSWRSPAPSGTWPTIDLFRPTVERLLALLDNWSLEHNLDSTSVDVAGFSQGGALTFTIGALHPNRIRKMGILAGFAPEGAENVLAPHSLAGKNIFVAHGTLDEMVPISMAYRTIRLLENSGAQVQFCQSDVGHKLSADCLKSLESYLED